MAICRATERQVEPLKFLISYETREVEQRTGSFVLEQLYREDKAPGELGTKARTEGKETGSSCISAEE